MESMAGLKGANIIVTGGAGFIGSHLVEALSVSGANVIVLDIAVNPKSYYVANRIFSSSRFELLDIRDRANVFSVIKKYSPHFIFHLAAEPIVARAFDNPYQTFETNIMGTVNILDAAREVKSLKGILVTSSDKAYGKTLKAYTEESPLKGDHPYDVSKSAQDLIAQTYQKSYNLPIIVTRFGNVYGEGDLHFSRIIPGICEAIIKNRLLEIRSDGKYVRDYLYVKDVAQGCLLLTERFPNLIGECFNFSSDESLPVLSVIKIAERALKVKVPYKILNIAKNEIPYQHLIDKKIKKLGWKNRYNLENTMLQIKDWYSSHSL